MAPGPQLRGITLGQLMDIARTSNPTLGQAQAGSILRAAGRIGFRPASGPIPPSAYAGDEIRGGSFGGGEQGVFIQQNASFWAASSVLIGRYSRQRASRPKRRPKNNGSASTTAFEDAPSTNRWPHSRWWRSG